MCHGCVQAIRISPAQSARAFGMGNGASAPGLDSLASLARYLAQVLQPTTHALPSPAHALRWPEDARPVTARFCRMIVCRSSAPVRGLRRAACVQQREGAGSAEAHAPAGAAAAMLPVSQVLAQQALAVSSGQPAVQEQSTGEYRCWTGCSCACIGFSYPRPQGPTPQLA